MKRKISKKFALGAVLLSAVVLGSLAYSHCQVPCGIYGDEGRFDAIAEHITTIEKSMKQIEAARKEVAENEKEAMRKGVERVALPKPGYLSEIRRRLQKTPWFKRLMRWRSGIEGCLSTLLRGGMKRCLWKGWRSFKSFIGLNVLTYNLSLLACQLC